MARELDVGYVRVIAEGSDFEKTLREILEKAGALAAKGGEGLGEEAGAGFGKRFKDEVENQLPDGPPVPERDKKDDEGPGEESGSRWAKAFQKGLEKVKEHSDTIFKATAVAAAATGAAITASVVGAMDQAGDTGKMAASLGLDEKTSKEYGKIAGKAYAAGYGEDFASVTDTMVAVASSFPEIGAKELEESTKMALNFAKAFDVDVNEALNSAQAMVNSGLAPSMEGALDALTKGMQETPAQIRGELLSASEEYSQFAASVGMTHEDMIGGMVGMTSAGMYGIDKYGDAIKEFTIITNELSKDTVKAFKDLGFDEKEDAKKLERLANHRSALAAKELELTELMSSKSFSTEAGKARAAILKQEVSGMKNAEKEMVKGMDEAGAEIHKLREALSGPAEVAGPAMKEVAARLQSIKDPAEQAAMAAALFGEPVKDLKQNVPAFIDSLANGSKALGDFEGATKGMDEALNDNAGANIEAFKRQITQTFIETVGNKIIPKLNEFAKTGQTAFAWLKEHPTTFKILAGAAATAAAVIGTAWAVGKFSAMFKMIGGAIQSAIGAAKWMASAAGAVKAFAIKSAIWLKERAIIVKNAAVDAASALKTAAIKTGIWVKERAQMVAHYALERAEVAKNFAIKVGIWAKEKAIMVGNAIASAAAWAKNTAVMVANRVATLAMSAAGKAYAAVQWAINAAMSANPIGLVVVAIAALAAGFVLAYKKSDTFRNIVNKTWEKIKEGATFLWEKVLKPIFSLWVGYYKMLWKGAVAAKDFIVGAFNKLRENAKNVFGFISEKFTSVIEGFKKVPEKIKNVATSFLNAGKELGKKMIEGLKTGLLGAGKAIKGMADTVWSAIKIPLNKAIDGLNAALEFEIRLPKKLGGYGFDVNPPDIPRFATGGHVWSAGASNRWNADDIMARLTKGEFVMQKRAVQSLEKLYPGLLEQMNRLGRLPGFSTGGVVTQLPNVRPAYSYAHSPSQGGSGRSGALIENATFNNSNAYEVVDEINWRLKARGSGLY